MLEGFNPRPRPLSRLLKHYLKLVEIGANPMPSCRSLIHAHRASCPPEGFRDRGGGLKVVGLDRAELCSWRYRV